MSREYYENWFHSNYSIDFSYPHVAFDLDGCQHIGHRQTTMDTLADFSETQVIQFE